MQDLKTLESDVAELGDSIGADALGQEIDTLEEKVNAPGFWDDPTESQNVLKQLKSKKTLYDRYISLKKSTDDVKSLAQLALEGDDEEMADEIIAEISSLFAEYEKQKIDIMLSGEYDGNNAIVSIHPGAGGTDSQDWA